MRPISAATWLSFGPVDAVDDQAARGGLVHGAQPVRRSARAGLLRFGGRGPDWSLGDVRRGALPVTGGLVGVRLGRACSASAATPAPAPSWFWPVRRPTPKR